MIALNINWFLATKGGRSSICPRHRIYRSGRRYSRRLRANRVSVGSMWIYLASDGNHGSAVAGPRFKHVKGNQEPLRPKAAWLKSSRVGFFLRVCAGRPPRAHCPPGVARRQREKPGSEEIAPGESEPNRLPCSQCGGRGYKRVNRPQHGRNRETAAQSEAAIA